MKILGIGSDVWISSAALVVDGKIVAAAPEERFNRAKMSQVFPHRAIDFCLKEAGIGLNEIDRFAFAWNPGVHIRSASRRYTGSLRWRGEFLSTVPAEILNMAGNPLVEHIRQALDTDDLQAEISYVDHHLCHAACTFFQSPFPRAAIFTMDGRGELATSTWNQGDGNAIERLQAMDLPHSIGLLYGTITQFLGFKAHSDEWKVMALASYGTADNPYVDKMRSLVTLLDDGTFEQDLTCFAYYLFDQQPKLFAPKLEALLGPTRQPSDEFNQRHMDIARALQQVFEETASHMLRHLYEMTGEKRLALAGGSAMNSVYNGKITELTPFEEVFIPSCPDDSGVSVGAALYAHYCEGNQARPSPTPQTHNFWGPQFPAEEIKDTLDRYKIRSEKQDDIAAVTARLLTEGKLVGWFQDRMEFGQRALGNRSILADPRNPKSKELVNAAVKFREGFRPFAPAVLAEHAGTFFDMPEGITVPFMERVFPVREDKRALIPAVVHVDGSGRLQTVSKDATPRFYSLIERFHELTGIPIILNTSFNLNGEPVVCTPSDAIRSFYTCGLDALVLGDYLVLK